MKHITFTQENFLTSLFLQLKKTKNKLRSIQNEENQGPGVGRTLSNPFNFPFLPLNPAPKSRVFFPFDCFVLFLKSMGTLPSSSIINPNFRFRQFPAGVEKTRPLDRSNAKNSCFLYRGRLYGGVLTQRRCSSSDRFDRLRCFSVDGNGGGEDKESSDSKLKTAEEADRKVNGESTPEQSRLSSLPSKVLKIPFVGLLI